MEGDVYVLAAQSVSQECRGAVECGGSTVSAGFEPAAGARRGPRQGGSAASWGATAREGGR